jgi:hypothetical protein
MEVNEWVKYQSNRMLKYNIKFEVMSPDSDVDCYVMSHVDLDLPQQRRMT